MMTITLAGVLGIIGATLAVLAAFGGAVGLYVGLVVRAELAAFMVQLNGTYLRTALYDQNLAEAERRTAAIDKRIVVLETTVGGRR